MTVREFDIKEKSDILDYAQVLRSAKEVDAIIHLAAITSVPYSINNPDETYTVNLEGTRAVLRAGIVSGVKKFVLASSCAVYGNAREIPTPEGAEAVPMSPYAHSKLRAEAVSNIMSPKFAYGATILRLFNVYGDGQKDGVVARFAKGGRSIHGDGTQTRDFIHVSDVMEAFVLALKLKEGGTFNIGTGKETAIIDLFHMKNLKAEPKFEAPRRGEVKRSCADIRRAKTVLGFEPKVML